MSLEPIARFRRRGTDKDIILLYQHNGLYSLEMEQNKFFNEGSLKVDKFNRKKYIFYRDIAIGSKIKMILNLREFQWSISEYTNKKKFHYKDGWDLQDSYSLEGKYEDGYFSLT